MSGDMSPDNVGGSVSGVTPPTIAISNFLHFCLVSRQLEALPFMFETLKKFSHAFIMEPFFFQFR